MLSICIDSTDLMIKDVQKRDFSTLIQWYQDPAHYRYATGFHKIFTMNDLVTRYEELIYCKDMFYLGIYLKPYFDIIGFMKGKLRCTDHHNILWLTSVMIDLSRRRQGYGSKCIDMLIHYCKRKYDIQKIYISVALENIEGVMFWYKKGFKEVEHIHSHKLFECVTKKIIIMEKDLTG